MHLQQNQQNEDLSKQKGQNQCKAEFAPSRIELAHQSSFLRHYSPAEEITDVQIHDFSHSSQVMQVEEPIFIDYVDQFLWSSPPAHQSSFFADIVNATTTSLQIQNSFDNIPPSLPQILLPQPHQTVEPAPAIHLPSKEKPNTELSKDYRKNLAGYIVKKVLRIILSSEYHKKLERACSKYSVDLESFKYYCQQSLPKLFGPNSIYELLVATRQAQKSLKEMLLHLISRILRKQYTLSILREGRMRDYDAYIQVKNQGLLYFSDLMP